MSIFLIPAWGHVPLVIERGVTSVGAFRKNGCGTFPWEKFGRNSTISSRDDSAVSPGAASTGPSVGAVRQSGLGNFPHAKFGRNITMTSSDNSAVSPGDTSISATVGAVSQIGLGSFQPSMVYIWMY